MSMREQAPGEVAFESDERLVERMQSLSTVATKVLAGTDDEKLTLARVVELAVLAVEGCDVATISTRVGNEAAQTPAATKESGVTADLGQYDLAEGPCLETTEVGNSFVANDLRTELRWPRWAPYAVQCGFGAIMSVRLVVPDPATASLNLYAHRPHAFDAQDVGIAHMYGAQASMALSAAHKLENLRGALSTRHTIGVAQGILMSKFGLDPDQAFEVMRRFSQESNRKLRSVADEIVAGSYHHLSP